MNTRSTPETSRSHEVRDTVIAISLIGAVAIGPILVRDATSNYLDNNFHPGQDVGKDLGIGNKSAEVSSQLESGLVHIDLQIPAFDIQNQKTDK